MYILAGIHVIILAEKEQESLSKQLNNIIREEDRTTLLTKELIVYQSHEPAKKGIEVDEW